MNNRLKEEMLNIVENQLKDNNPKAVLRTIERLIAEGYTDLEAREMIASLLLVEMHGMLQNDETFNQKRYVRKLLKLPYSLNSLMEDEEATADFVAVKPAVKRNDPCHCGSGKKFKKCCGV